MTQDTGTMIKMNLKTMNSLPAYWGVVNDGSQLFKDTVIEYLNKTYECNMSLKNDWIYTVGRSGVWMTDRTDILVKILTIEEFIKLSSTKLDEWGFIAQRKKRIYEH